MTLELIIIGLAVIASANIIASDDRPLRLIALISLVLLVNFLLYNIVHANY